MLTNAEISLLGLGLWETIYMTVLSTLFAYIIGLPMGVVLVTSDKDGILPMPKTNKVLNIVVNLVRSVPFLILLVAVIPFTRLVVGKAYGCNATIVPLVIAAAPFVARLVESSLREIDKGMIEASLSMGAGPWQIIRKVLLPEAKPSLILGAAIATTTILGYSAMAGFVGGGGLGTIAINYGYYRYQTGIMLITVVLLVVVVQIFQEIGDRLAVRSDKRK
ncbi:MAG: ABC transporter permease [Clostridia bacterium]|nr:ABC transporter permease [Clostridia bacterium]MDD4798366.1 ABC transporter permease [Clostridia bacterium]